MVKQMGPSMGTPCLHGVVQILPVRRSAPIARNIDRYLCSPIGPIICGTHSGEVALIVSRSRKGFDLLVLFGASSDEKEEEGKAWQGTGNENHAALKELGTFLIGVSRDFAVGSTIEPLDCPQLGFYTLLCTKLSQN